jgi:hypothetical protein
LACTIGGGREVPGSASTRREDIVSESFDIENRQTWAWEGRWAEPNQVDGPPCDDPRYMLHTLRPDAFFEVGEGGIPYRHDCPLGLKFSPFIYACDFPQNVPEPKIYEWAVGKGYVADQR